MEIMRPEARLCFNALLKKHMLLFTMPHIRGFILKMLFFFFFKGLFYAFKILMLRSVPQAFPMRVKGDMI